MKKKTLIILVILIGGFGLLLLFVYHGLKPRRAELFDSYVYETLGFKIKAETRYQEGGLLPLFNAYHDYYVKTDESDHWRLILTLIWDDPLKIPEDQIRNVSDDVTYLFIGWMYAVTTDGGESWETWNGNPKVAQLMGTGYGFIDEIQMDANGLGVMSVVNGQGELTELHTNNFGKTWKKATRMIN